MANSNNAVKTCAAGKRFHHGSLTDACFACYKYGSTLSSAHLLQQRVQSRERHVTPDNLLPKSLPSQLRFGSGLMVSQILNARRQFALRNRRNESIAAPMCGLNELGRLWIIAECFANLTNRDLKDGLSDKCLRPHGVEELLFCDELARVRKEIAEDCESFGPKPYCAPGSR
jgi:hypothetical protein